MTAPHAQSRARSRLESDRARLHGDVQAKTSLDSHSTASTFLAIESLSRRAHFGRDVLHLSDAALSGDLHTHNDRASCPLPASFVDELADAITRTDR